METIKILHDLNDKGYFDQLVKSGFISCNQKVHYQVYCRYKEIRSKYKTSKDVYDIICHEFNISHFTVKKIIQRFNNLN